MIPVQTKEHLIYVMQSGLMRLGKYDLKFMQDLQILTLQKVNLTTNQVSLFDKLTEKYKRQLAQHGISSLIVAGLPWESTIVPSDPKYTEAYVDIQDGVITFKSPFSQKFVEAFRKIEYNPFAWSKEKRAYLSSYSTHALKILLTNVINYYPVVNYCPVTLELLNILEKYNAPHWNPTMVKVNDRYMIAAINDKLADAISHIELSADPLCLVKLAKYGIEVDVTVTNNDPLLEFASKYIVDADFKYIDEFITHLKAVECDAVFTVGNTGMTLPYKKILADKLQEADIKHDARHSQVLESRIVEHKNPILISMSNNAIDGPGAFMKIVRMRNSLPIQIK